MSWFVVLQKWCSYGVSCHTQVMQRWAPVSLSASPWCVQYLRGLNSCRVTPPALSLSAPGMSPAQLTALCMLARGVLGIPWLCLLVP